MEKLVTGDPLNCRDVVNELGISGDDFARATGLDPRQVDVMRVSDSNIPSHLLDKVNDLRAAKNVTYVSPMAKATATAVLEHLKGANRMRLDHLCRTFNIGIKQLARLQQETGWITIGWHSTDASGSRAYVAITTGGLREIGVVTGVGASFDKTLDGRIYTDSLREFVQEQEDKCAAAERYLADQRTLMSIAIADPEQNLDDLRAISSAVALPLALTVQTTQQQLLEHKDDEDT